MGIENIAINSGTGPAIAADLVGTDYYQVVKIAQGGDGVVGNIGAPFSITGSVGIANSPTVTISNNPIVITGTVAGITVSVTSGAFSIIGTPTVTATLSPGSVVQATVSNTLLTVTGTVVGTPFGTQNVAIQGTPVMTATISNALLTVTGTVGALFLQKLDATNDSVTVWPRGIGTAWRAFAVNTTSGASAIVKTSGANTLYVTDLIVSVDVPSTVSIFSAATTLMSLYLATKGGMAIPFSTPLILNSNQSLTFQPSASGSAMCAAIGYTVT